MIVVLCACIVVHLLNVTLLKALYDDHEAVDPSVSNKYSDPLNYLGQRVWKCFRTDERTFKYRRIAAQVNLSDTAQARIRKVDKRRLNERSSNTHSSSTSSISFAGKRDISDDSCGDEKMSKRELEQKRPILLILIMTLNLCGRVFVIPWILIYTADLMLTESEELAEIARGIAYFLLASIGLWEGWSFACKYWELTACECPLSENQVHTYSSSSCPFSINSTMCLYSKPITATLYRISVSMIILT
jgi:hypothetical protein